MVYWEIDVQLRRIFDMKKLLSFILLIGIVTFKLSADDNLELIKEFKFDSRVNQKNYYEGRSNYEVKNYPSALTFDKKDNLYIFDSANHRISIWDKSYNFVKDIYIEEFVEAERIIVYDSGILVYDYSGNQIAVLFYSYDGSLIWKISEVSNTYMSRCDSGIYDEDNKAYILLTDDNPVLYYNLNVKPELIKKETDINKINKLLGSNKYSFKGKDLYIDNKLYKKDANTQINKNSSKLFYIGEDKDNNCIYSNTDLGIISSGKDGNTVYLKRFSVEDGEVIRFPAVDSKGCVYILVYMEDKAVCNLYKLN